jgi:metal-dependent hydrolase (beta-lactamase superfamily II)
VRVLLNSDFQINDHWYQIDTKQWTLPKVGIVYVVNSRKTFLVDAGTSQPNEKILSTLEEFNISPKSANTIVVTHEHYDHGAGVAGLLEKMPNTLVCASKKNSGNTEKLNRVSGNAQKALMGCCYACERLPPSWRRSGG